MTETKDNMGGDTATVAPFYARNKFPIALVIVTVIVISGALLFAKMSAQASLNEDQAARERALVVSTSILKESDSYQVKQKYSGSIVAGRESDHGFDKAGLLAEVMVDEGDRVKKGDILARLDMRRFDARERELDADLSQAKALDVETKALLDRAEATYGRYVVLLDKKHISEQKFDQVKFDLIALKARKVATSAAVTKSEAALKSLGIDRELATLTARFDGSVIRRYLDEGTALSAGTPVVRLIEDHRLEIHVGLPASAVFSLVPGESHIFDYQSSRITTKLRSVIKRVDQSTRTVTAIFDVTNNNMNIRAGGLAQLTMYVEIQQAGFWLPSGALAESRRGLWSVYTLKPHKGSKEYGTLARQELQVIYTDSNRVFVRGTLQAGDRVISGGLHRLVPGQLVRVSGES